MPSLVDRLWADRRLEFRAARAALTPLAWTFEAVTRGRGVLYDTGVLRARRADVPVVSVGNLRVGGTGKTPLVMWLVERLRACGVRAAVVARGYGSDGSLPTVVSTDAAPVRRGVEADLRDTRRAHVHADGTIRKDGNVADEALLVALRTGAPVVTAIDRYEACRIAAWAFAPDLVLLDDGFQHRRLWRDLDIVLVDPSDRAAGLLPAGPLREPWRALRRADVVLATRPTAASPYVVRAPVGLVRRVSMDADVAPLASLAGQRVVVAAGVAHPDEVASMVAAAGADVRAVLAFGDHHSYTRRDRDRIARESAGVARIVTTEKDLVKLVDLAQADERVVALRIGIEVEGADALVDIVCTRSRLDPKRRGQHDPEPSRVRNRR